MTAGLSLQAYQNGVSHNMHGIVYHKVIDKKI